MFILVTPSPGKARGAWGWERAARERGRQSHKRTLDQTQPHSGGRKFLVTVCGGRYGSTLMPNHSKRFYSHSNFVQSASTKNKHFEQEPQPLLQIGLNNFATTHMASQRRSKFHKPLASSWGGALEAACGSPRPRAQLMSSCANVLTPVISPKDTPKTPRRHPKDTPKTPGAHLLDRQQKKTLATALLAHAPRVPLPQRIPHVTYEPQARQHGAQWPCPETLQKLCWGASSKLAGAPTSPSPSPSRSAPGTSLPKFASTSSPPEKSSSG